MPTLRPKYIPYIYMDPLGWSVATKPPQGCGRRAARAPTEKEDQASQYHLRHV